MNILNGLTVKQYLAWKEEGLKDADILEKLHYSPNSQMMLMKWKKENGIGQTRKSSKKYTRKIGDTIDINRVIQLRKNGFTQRQIAEILGLANHTFETFLLEQFKKGTIERKYKRVGGSQ